MASGHSQALDCDYLTVARQPGTSRCAEHFHHPFRKIGRLSPTIGSSQSKVCTTGWQSTTPVFRGLRWLCPVVVSSPEPGRYPEWTAGSREGVLSHSLYIMVLEYLPPLGC